MESKQTNSMLTRAQQMFMKNIVRTLPQKQLSESEKEKKDYLRAIELNDEDPEGYYYLADF